MKMNEFKKGNKEENPKQNLVIKSVIIAVIVAC